MSSELVGDCDLPLKQVAVGVEYDFTPATHDSNGTPRNFNGHNSNSRCSIAKNTYCVFGHGQIKA
jgi:hypothetical protein